MDRFDRATVWGANRQFHSATRKVSQEEFRSMAKGKSAEWVRTAYHNISLLADAEEYRRVAESAPQPLVSNLLDDSFEPLYERRAHGVSSSALSDDVRIPTLD